MIEWVWLMGLGMALAAGVWLALGGRGSGVRQLVDRRKLNARAIREHLQELETQRADGELSEADFEQARALIGATAEDDLQQAGGAWTAGDYASWQRWVLVVLPVVLTAGIFVMSDGDQHFEPRQSQTAGEQRSIEDMVTGLAARLEQQPDDLRGWAMLGRSYQVLERYADAAQAYARANALADGKNAELLIAEAEVRGMLQDRSLQGRPTELINAALAIDPDNIQALWYALIAATQRADGAARHEYLQRLAAEPDLPPELAQLLQDEFAVTPVALKAAETAGPALSVRVDLAGGVRDKIDAGSTLFVYAKAQQGPPMPLAVHRQPVASAQWPVEVTLDDSMSMLPDMTLSSVDAWTLVARISQSGQAIPQSGDWMVSRSLDSIPGDSIELTISEQLP